jgi:hypothetical protein
VRDPDACYWGGRVEEHSLVPLGEARLGYIGLDEWPVSRSQKANASGENLTFDTRFRGRLTTQAV